MDKDDVHPFTMPFTYNKKGYFLNILVFILDINFIINI